MIVFITIYVYFANILQFFSYSRENRSFFSGKNDYAVHGAENVGYFDEGL